MRRTVALAGLGSAARTIHLPAIARLQDLTVVGGFDPAAKQDEFPFALFPSLEALLDSVRPDILVVATPPECHFEQARQGLLAGCHVLCEKPFTTTLQEADELVALARSQRRWLVVNHEFRFLETSRAVKRAIGQAEFGELQFVSAFQSFTSPSVVQGGWRAVGGQRTCEEFGIHVLDLCRFFFDVDPLRIHARMPRGAAPGGPDRLDLIELTFPGDRVAHITLDRIAKGRHRYLDLRIDGTSGTIESSLGGRLAMHVGLSAATRRPFVALDVAKGGRARLYHGERFKTIATEPTGIFASATTRLMRAFVDALNEGTVPPCHAEDARRSLALVHAAYESDARCGPLDLTGGSATWMAR